MPYMDYVTRDKIAKNSEQVLTSFDWEFRIDFPDTYQPYHPDLELIRVRTTDISGVEELPTGDPMQIPMRGFTLIQPGLTNNFPPPFQINAQDFEDQAIKVWLLDWMEKSNSMRTRKSYRREDLFVNITIWRLNSDRKRVYQYKYFNCLPSNPTYEGAFSGTDKSPVGRTTIGIQAEYMEPTPLNVA